MIERRTFLALAALGATELFIGGPISCASASKPKTPSPLSLSYGPKGKVLFCLNASRANQSTLRLYDWDQKTFQDYPVSMGFVHSIVQDPKNPSVVFLFELLGSGGRLDLESGEFIKVDQLDGDMFNGHGALSRSGEIMASTEIDKSRSSRVVFRSSKNLSKTGFAPKECDNSHQVASLPGSSLMAAGVMRGYDGKTESGAITFFDGETGRVANRIDFPLPVLHVLPLSATEVVGVSFASTLNKRSRPEISSDKSATANIEVMNQTMTFVPGPLYYASLDGKRQVLWDERARDLFVYNFGLAKIEGHRFLSGHQYSGKVVLWDELHMKKVIDVPEAKNIVVSHDGSEFIVLSGLKPVAYSLSTFEKTATFDGWPDVVTFSGYNV